MAAFQYFKVACKQDGDKLISRACCDRTRANGLKLEEHRFRLAVRNKFFTCSVQGQAGWGFEQPGLREGVPTHDRGLELDNL